MRETEIHPGFSREFAESLADRVKMREGNNEGQISNGGPLSPSTVVLVNVMTSKYLTRNLDCASYDCKYSK